MTSKVFVALAALVGISMAQRPFYAGKHPIGYPTLQPKDQKIPYQELPLPLEAQGDRELVENLSKLPVDQQPFWLINWQALKENRERPQTYDQRPDGYIGP